MGFDGIVYVPEYSTCETRGDYNVHVMCEKNCLTNATIIVFFDIGCIIKKLYTCAKKKLKKIFRLVIWIWLQKNI